MPNPNIESVNPISVGLAFSWRSSSGREIWSNPVARVEKVSDAMRPLLGLRIREGVMVAYVRCGGPFGA